MDVPRLCVLVFLWHHHIELRHWEKVLEFTPRFLCLRERNLSVGFGNLLWSPFRQAAGREKERRSSRLGISSTSGPFLNRLCCGRNPDSVIVNGEYDFSGVQFQVNRNYGCMGMFRGVRRGFLGNAKYLSCNLIITYLNFLVEIKCTFDSVEVLRVSFMSAIAV